eukprot:gene69079-94666_t
MSYGAKSDPNPMSERAPPELSARALISRVAGVYLRPRGLGWTGALIAAVAAAVFTTLLVQILEPATNDLMANPRPRTLLPRPGIPK